MIFPPVETTINKGHGRLEVRAIQTSTLLNNFVRFPYCGQVFKITREVTKLKTGEIYNETVYGITSLTQYKADSLKLLSINRKHWSIENSSHYVRDFTYDEDRSQVRTKKGPQMMSCLRNIAISLLRLVKEKNIAKAVREIAARPYLALRLLGV